MKLLKTTMAVAIASLLCSAAFAEEAKIEYQVTQAATPAVVTYNGEVLLDGANKGVSIIGGHESVFVASANMKISSLELPCSLNNSSFATAVAASNQFLLEYSLLTVKEKMSDVVSYELAENPGSAGGACGNVNGTVADNSTTSGTLKTTTVALPIAADQVSYTVTPVAHTGNAPVAGAYRGAVTVTTTAG